MELWQAGFAAGAVILAAALGAYGAVKVERLRIARESKKEEEARAKELSLTDSHAYAQLERARIDDNAAHRREIEEEARGIREFLGNQVEQLFEAINGIEEERKRERAEYAQERETRLRLEWRLELYEQRYGKLEVGGVNHDRGNQS